MKNRIFALLTVLLISGSLYAAKNTYIVQGKVIEKSNGSPLPFATISVHDNENKVVTGTTSDNDGSFIVNLRDHSNCLVKVSFIGFRDTLIQVKANGTETKINLGTISMTADAVNLSAAVVTSKVPVIEQKLDKIVMNVSEAVSTQGVNALDVLKKAPGVSVDLDGNITLNGSAVQVWIDGRPSNLSGKEIETLLSGTDGSTIDKIEFISHPSSRYDASGSGGIINIKTKRNFAQGISGTVRGGYNVSFYEDTDHSANGSLNINYRTEKSSSSLTYSPRVYNGFEQLDTRTYLNDGYDLLGTTRLQFGSRSQTMRFSSDYNINKNHIVGFIVNGMLQNGHHKTGGFAGTTLYSNSGQAIERVPTQINGDDLFNYINTNVNYSGSFSDKHEITINADYGYYETGQFTSQQHSYFDQNWQQIKEPQIFESKSDQAINILSFRTDYEWSISDKSKVESGFKWARSSTDNSLVRKDFEQNEWRINPLYSSEFDYIEDVGALYLSASTKISPKLSIKAGVRGELSNSKGLWESSDTTTKISEAKLFPTLFVGYNPNKDNRLGLSYSKRIRRPNFRQLNPFQMHIDAVSTIEGNPELRPQYTHLINLSYGFKRHLNISLMGSFTDQTITQTPIFNNETGEKRIVFENFGQQNYMGISLSLTELSITKWFYVTSNIFVADYKTKNRDFKNQVTFAQGHLNTTFILPKNYKFEVIGNYRTAVPFGLFVMQPSGGISAGLKKGMFENKGNLTITANDIFRTEGQNGIIKEGRNKVYEINGYSNSQRIVITYSHSFGQSRATKQRKVGNLEEGSRAGL